MRKLDSCHIVAVNRGNQDSLQTTKPGDPPPVMFLDIWMSGDDAQFRLTRSTGGRQEWWVDSTFRPLMAPLTAGDLESVPGMKVCLRPKGDFLWAEARFVNQTSSSPFKTLYSRSTSLRPTQVFYLPLLHLNRSWARGQRGAWLAVNHLVEGPVASWRLLGREKRAGVDTIVFEIPDAQVSQVSLRRYTDTLSFTQTWKAWFSTNPSEGYFPRRMERSIRYVFRGKEYRYERSQASVPSSVVFEANGIAEVEPGVWYPRYGRQDSFYPTPASKLPFDPDRIVDKLLSEGKFVDDEQYVLTTSREWRLLDLKLIEPTHDLWFEPPRESCVLNVDTDARFVAGVSETESTRRLGTPHAGKRLQLSSRGGSSLWWILISLNVVIALVLALRFARVWRKR
jgi:hypothetical protein